MIALCDGGDPTGQRVIVGYDAGWLRAGYPAIFAFMAGRTGIDAADSSMTDGRQLQARFDRWSESLASTGRRR